MRKLLPNPWRPVVAYFLSALLLLQVAACTYFQERSVPPAEIRNVQQVGDLYRYFLVHQGDSLFFLIDLSLEGETIVGDLREVTFPVFYEDGRTKHVKYRERDIVQEAHIYLKETATLIDYGPVRIPFEDVREIRLLERDKGRSTGATLLAVIGGTLAGLVALMLIVALIKSSCPYVYSFDGSGYVFSGEMFGGAIGPNLERDDYLPLPHLSPKNGRYRLRITNELQERQYTDLAELLIVSHATNSTVLLDDTGRAFQFSNPMVPSTARSGGGNDLMEVVRDRDDRAFRFDEMDTQKTVLTLTFPRPDSMHSAALVLRAKNTFWVDYLYGDIMESFGIIYPWYTAAAHRLPPEERRQQVVDARLPLTVSTHSPEGWTAIKHIPTVGPMQARDFIVPLPPGSLNGDSVKIKLETGFAFWALDYTALAADPITELETVTLKPYSALGTGNVDWTSTLMNTDQQYMVQEEPGLVTEIIYKEPAQTPQRQTSAFLHTRGYYEWIRDYSGWPDVEKVRSFMDPAFLSAYSRQHYQQIARPAALQ